MWRRLLALSVSLVVAAATGAAAASTAPEQPLQQSPNPPSWTKTSTHCVVDLQDASHPSGVVGYIGYNVSLLLIVDRRHIPCPRAKRYARAEWVHGPAGQPLFWRYVRAWRSTAGSAYVGDFKGRHGKKLVEYLAVH
jgi:hypothetical protein